MFVDQKNLNRTIAIDSPFQTFAVGLLVEFRLALPLVSPKTLPEQLVDFLLMHTIYFLSEDDIIMVSSLKDR